MRFIVKFLPLALLAVLCGGIPVRAASVLTYHNDTSSSGVNASETVLTPANLTVSTFAKKYSTPIDGVAYAQPLYMPGVVVTGGSSPGTHNLVFVATQHDSLYAIDANSGAVVWKDSFLTNGLAGATSITSVPSGDTGSTDTAPEIGICSTPVIDPATKLLYVTAKTKQIINGNTSDPSYVYTIYKIDITNGAANNANIESSLIFGTTAYDGTYYTFGSVADPSALQDPFVVGTAPDAVTVNGESRVYFNALREMNRPALLLYNGTIYVAFGSHGDNQPYHGWLIGFDKGTLAINGVLNLTPNGGLGGIWNSGGGPTVDSSGNIYVMTGNGTFDGDNSGGTVTGLNGQNMPQNADYGDSIVKIATDPTTSAANQNVNGWGLKVLDYFAPFNNQPLSSADSDLGAGGITILPDSAGSTAHPHLLVGAGKQGEVYLVDRDAMGEYSTSDNVVQSQQAIGGSFDTPAFFNGVLYYGAANDNGKAFTISNATMSTSPVTTPDTFAWPGSTPSVSANGTSNAIVWMIDRSTGQLRAYSATNLHSEIWTSALAPANRDQLGTVTKFATPTVADGNVFVGTTTALVTYSAISAAAVGTPPLVATSSATTIGAESVTLNGLVNPKGSVASVSFQYGTSTSYSSSTTSQTTGSGSAVVSFAIPQGGLTPKTVYHFRAVATNSDTTVYGADKIFTTLAEPTIAANSSVYGSASATEVSASVTPNGVSTSVYFQYGTTTSYGTVTPTQSAGAGAAAVTVFGLFSGLTPGATYHYQVVTTSAAGTFYGSDETFTASDAISTLVTTKSDPAPDISGATFLSFDNPAINSDNDHTAFKATLTTGLGGVTTANNSGIWADNSSGNMHLVARVGVGLAPSTTATFATLSDPVYNNNDAVAFRATLRVGTGEAATNASTGIWCNSTGSLALVALQGEQAAGCPTGATFANFTQLALPDQGGATNKGGAILLATLNASAAAGVSAANDLGIWAVDTTGTLQLVVRTGDVVGGKKITGLAFLPAMTYVTGQTRSFDQVSGDVVYLATFSDGSTGIVTVTLP